jgi:hypothetical protein
MKHWWKKTNKGKLKYIEKNLYHCHFLHHKFHMDWSGTEPGLPR